MIGAGEDEQKRENAQLRARAAALELQSIHKYLGKNHVLRDVSVSFPKDAVTCIVGPSGSGKSTLLKCLNLLLLVDEGEIRLDGTPVICARKNTVSRWGLVSLSNLFLFGRRGSRHSRRTLYIAPYKHRRRVSMVFQEFNLWQNKTVLGNLIEGPVHALGLSRAESKARAERILSQVGLPDALDRYPEQLSGGQRQRVAIARALMMEPEVLLLDEVTSALDPELIGEVLEVLRMLARSGVTLIIVTHHMQFARSIADKIVMLDNGRVVEEGSAEQVLDNPNEERTALFLRKLDAAR